MTPTNLSTQHKLNCICTLKRQLIYYPFEPKRLELTVLQRKLQQMIARAKSDYQTNLTQTYAQSNNDQIF